MNNGRYYWLKLRENFFDEDTIAWLEEQENGKDYVLFYLKLCLKSLNTDGCLIRRVGDMLIPYEVRKLAEMTNTDFDTAVVALELLKKIGLVEVLESGEIYMTKLFDMVGSEAANGNAQRQRRFRERKKKEALQAPVTDGVTKSNTEIRDKSIEIEIDKEIDKDKEKAAATKSDDIDKEFENLWSLYPRKQGQANALKAYRKARKGKPEVYKTVEDGIKRYISYLEKKKTKPEYIKQGSTWFNQRCWEDDYSTGCYGNDGTYKGLDKASRWGKVGQEF